MFIYQDYMAAKQRHQDQIAYAEQHSLRHRLIDECIQKPGCMRRILNWAGKKLVALGNQMQTPGVGHGPTPVSG